VYVYVYVYGGVDSTKGTFLLFRTVGEKREKMPVLSAFQLSRAHRCANLFLIVPRVEFPLNPR